MTEELPPYNEKFGKYTTKHEGFEVLVEIHGSRVMFGRHELLISSTNGSADVQKYVTASKIRPL